MKRTLVVTKQAEIDLSEIWLWTYTTFGQTQADRYLDQLDHEIQQCGEHAEAGKDRSSLRPNYRSLRVGKHVIFCTFTASQVVVQRVLHASMDFEVHLP